MSAPANPLAVTPESVDPRDPVSPVKLHASKKDTPSAASAYLAVDGADIGLPPHYSSGAYRMAVVSSRSVQYKWRRGGIGQEGCAVPEDRVLIATDLSQSAEAVLRSGLILAKRLAAETLVLHVFDEREYQEQHLAMPRLSIDEYAGNLAMRLRHLIASLELPHEHAQVEVLPGGGAAVADQILAAAHRMKVGLVVVGTHGRTGLPRVVMGSVAEAVVRHSDIPVLVVPTRAPASEEAPAFS
jgi:nucleotide-binding universal stress UspA family protein